MRIVVIDLCPETNRGDAAMQVGLLSLLRQSLPEAEISLMTILGANQKDSLRNEYDHTYQMHEVVLGGMKPTFYPIGRFSGLSGLASEVLNAIGLFAGLIFLGAIKAGVPLRALVTMLPRDYRNSFQALIQADMVFWKGRNLRSRPSAALELYRIVNTLFHPLICLALKKPLALVSGSFWPLRSRASRWIVRSVVNQCLYISCREAASVQVARSFTQTKTHVIIEQQPDLSFALYHRGSLRSSSRICTQPPPFPEKIGLTLMDWQGAGKAARKQYIQSVRGLLDVCVEKGTLVTIIPQVVKKWEATASLIQELLESHPVAEKIQVIPGNPMIDDLLTIYSNQDLLVATRMVVPGDPRG